MKAPVAGVKGEGGSVVRGSAAAWHLMREYGIGLCSGKSPVALRRGVIGAAAIWAGRKKDLDITTRQCAEDNSGQNSQINMKLIFLTSQISYLL